MDTRENEWRVANYDECLDRRLNHGFTGCCGCFREDAVYEGCFAAGERGVDSLTASCRACQCDCRDEELLESGTRIISLMI